MSMCTKPYPDQDSIPTNLGENSNALIWPKGPPADSDEDDELDNYKNERFMRLGKFISVSKA